jgi:hypothetical protein
MKALAALFYFMLGYTLGGLQFGGSAKDVTWGGIVTIGIAALRFVAGYLILNPAAQELSQTSKGYKWASRTARKTARKVRGIAHYLDGHGGKSYSCHRCRA